MDKHFLKTWQEDYEARRMVADEMAYLYEKEILDATQSVLDGTRPTALIEMLCGEGDDDA